MSYIENTWIAYAFERNADPGRVEAGLDRVEAHYAELYADPLIRHDRSRGALGMALWHRDDERLRWPLWAEEGPIGVAATNAPTGWERLVGDLGPDAAAVPLGRALRDDPDRAVELNPPFVLAVHDEDAGTLTIVNDFIATGRLYELRTPELTLWSNRLGALPLFAGVRPEASPEGWALLAAGRWFLGRTTPFRGIEKIAPGSAIVARDAADGAEVTRRETSAVHTIVAPRALDFDRAAAEAAAQSVGLARSIGALWTVPPQINFSGGRDSRISAAGAVVAGIEADYRTMDIEPGEADVVRGLVADAPRPIPLAVTQPERGEPEDDLPDRIGALQRVHDAISNPMSITGAPMRLPQRNYPRPLVTGHGGELGHGFYYSEKAVKRLGKQGLDGVIDRLERSGRQKHNAAREQAYEAYIAEVRRTVDEGLAHGVDGPSLLDYFYLAQRLSFRAGLGSRNDRYSACATPAFVRASFDLAPEERAAAKLHKAIVGRLVPAWRDAPFFHGGSGPLPEMNRDRIWEKPRHSGQLEEMLGRDELWSDLFRPDRIREMWAEVKAGGGHSSYEPVFLRIAWRVGFESHLELLGDRATRDPSPVRPAA